jgi:hypothetical protein
MHDTNISLVSFNRSVILLKIPIERAFQKELMTKYSMSGIQAAFI